MFCPSQTFHVDLKKELLFKFVDLTVLITDGCTWSINLTPSLHYVELFSLKTISIKHHEKTCNRIERKTLPNGSNLRSICYISSRGGCLCIEPSCLKYILSSCRFIFIFKVNMILCVCFSVFSNRANQDNSSTAECGCHCGTEHRVAM